MKVACFFLKRAFFERELHISVRFSRDRFYAFHRESFNVPSFELRFFGELEIFKPIDLYPQHDSLRL